jgi:hypothetical protein
MDASLWGPHLWKVIHLFALNYPEQPSVSDRSCIKQFFYQLQYLIPCTTCAANYAKHLKELPIDGYLTEKNKLFEWTVKLHNIVNNELNKPQISVEQAAQIHLNKPTSKFGGWVALAIGVIGILVLVLLILLYRFRICKYKNTKSK